MAIIAVIAGTGYYVWHSRQGTNKTQNNAQVDSSSQTSIKTFADCQKSIGSTTQQSYPEVCVTKGGQRFTQPTSDQSQVPYTTTYSKVPAALQKVILAETTNDAPACVKGDQLIDVNGKPDDPRVDYAPSGAAATGIGCDGGSWGLFSKDSNGNWKFLVKSQMDFDCSTLEAYHVPKALIELNEESQCFDSHDNVVQYNG